jgi:hypothetical protein
LKDLKIYFASDMRITGENGYHFWMVAYIHIGHRYILSKSEYRRRTDNTMAKGKSTKGQTTIYKTYI